MAEECDPVKSGKLPGAGAAAVCSQEDEALCSPWDSHQPGSSTPLLPGQARSPGQALSPLCLLLFLSNAEVVPARFLGEWANSYGTADFLWCPQYPTLQ